ncbi:MAG: radical SAM family heme chaperone HemW [Bacteroidota bacterium]
MLYIHIPFCKQACHYCDFHFSTNLEFRDKMVEAICKEMESRKGYLSSNKLASVYLGGGTPSLLTEKNLEKIFQTIHSNFEMDENAEITLEANPDDLDYEKLKLLKAVGVNRLSIGVQSFDESHLKFMNRAHSSKEALCSIENAKKAGFDNLTIDLIYGIPSESHHKLLTDIEIATSFNIHHISAYCLTIEPKTTFGKWVKTHKLKPIDENFASEQFEILMRGLAKKGFEQYEISNFAKNGHYSKHNSSYWLGNQYLGIGPSAHSFDGNSRQFNIANNSLYIKGIDTNNQSFELETLTDVDKTNEYLMTSLRTIWGTDLNRLSNLSNNRFEHQNQKVVDNYIIKNWVRIQDSKLTLTEAGKFFADQIAANLFIE